jgi:hypothetical protein
MLIPIALAYLLYFASFIKSTKIDFTYQICTGDHAETTANIALSFEGIPGITSLTAPSKGYQRTVSLDIGSLDPSKSTISFTMSITSSDGVCFSHVDIDGAIVFEETMWFDNPCDGSVNPCFSSKTFPFRTVPFTYQVCSAAYSQSATPLELRISNIPNIPIYGKSAGLLKDILINIGDVVSYQSVTFILAAKDSDAMCLNLIKIGGVTVLDSSLWFDNPCSDSDSYGTVPCVTFRIFQFQITRSPTLTPTQYPSLQPTLTPTQYPSLQPTISPKPTTTLRPSYKGTSSYQCQREVRDSIDRSCSNRMCAFGVTSIIGRGYDITYGLSTESLKARIYEFTSASSTVMLNGIVYSVPPTSEMKVDAIDSTHHTIDEMSTYHNSVKSHARGLSIHLNLESVTQAFSSKSGMYGAILGGLGVKASVTKKISRSVEMSEFTFNQYSYVTKARYEIHHPAVYGHLCDSVFFSEIKNLPELYDSDRYLDFIRNFGTHVVVGADVGGYIQMSISKSSKEYKSQVELKVDAQVANEMMGQFAVESTKTREDILGTTVSRTDAEICGGNSATYMSPATDETNWNLWTTSLFQPGHESVCPVKVKLVPISELATTPEQLANLETAIMDYSRIALNTSGLSTATVAIPPRKSSSSACFHPSSEITLATGDKKLIDSVEIGDWVVVADAFGKLTHAEVIFIPHSKDNKIISHFLTLTTLSPHLRTSLKVTHNHLVMIEKSCSSSQRSLVRADEITLSDCLVVTSTTGREGASQPILSIIATVEEGIQTLITSEPSGLLVVNGVVCSSFGELHILPNFYYSLYRLFWSLGGGFRSILRDATVRHLNEMLGNLLSPLTLLPFSI